MTFENVCDLTMESVRACVNVASDICGFPVESVSFQPFTETATVWGCFFAVRKAVGIIPSEVVGVAQPPSTATQVQRTRKRNGKRPRYSDCRICDFTVILLYFFALKMFVSTSSTISSGDFLERDV